MFGKLTTRQRGLVNVIGIGLCRGVVTILTLVLVPFMIRHFGKEDYGIYELVRSLVGWMPLLTLAISPALSRYVTHAIGRDDREGVNRYMSAGVIAMAAISCFVVVAGGAVVLALPWIFDLGGLENQAQVFLFLLVIALAVNYAFGAFSAPLYSREMLAESNAVLVVNDIVKFTLIVAAFSLVSVNLIWPGIASIVGATATGVLLLASSYRVFPWLRLSARIFDRSALRELISFSLFSTIGLVTQAIYFSTDNILIKAIYGPAGAGMITVYRVGIIWDGWIRSALTPLLRVVYPRMTLLSSQDQRSEMRRLVLTGMRYATAMIAPVCLFLCFFGEPILTLWVGSELSGQDIRTAAGILPIVLIPLIFALGTAPSQAVYVAEGKIAVPTYVGLTGALINVVLSIVLARYAGWDLYGVAAGTGITFFLIATVFVPCYLKRLIGLRLRDFYVRGVSRSYVLGILYAGLCWGVRTAFDPRSLVELLIVLGLSGILYAAGAWFLVLLPWDRGSILGWVRKATLMMRGPRGK